MLKQLLKLLMCSPVETWKAFQNYQAGQVRLSLFSFAICCQAIVVNAQQPVPLEQQSKRLNQVQQSVLQLLQQSPPLDAEVNSNAENTEQFTEPSPINPEVREICNKLATVISREEFASALSRAKEVPTQGKLIETNRSLDIAIEGIGYLRACDPTSGVIYHVRKGTLDINATGQLVVGTAHKGLVLNPAVVIPEETVTVVITADGKVMGRMAGEVELRLFGYILLSKFSNPQELAKVDSLRFYATEDCGVESINTPGSNGVGVVRQGLLEDLEIDPMQELAQQLATLIDLEIRERN